MEKNNLILIGMPGVGKSTIGVILAKILGYQFVDSDLVIQNTEGKLLHEIIDEQGVDGFIAVENRVNCSLNPDKTVIATGGSAVYGAEAMAHFHEIGIILYLKLSFEPLMTRLGDIHERGVILREGQTMRDLYEERIRLYEKYADITVSEDDLSIEQTIEAIRAKL